jgi:hypothetical protein
MEGLFLVRFSKKCRNYRLIALPFFLPSRFRFSGYRLGDLPVSSVSSLRF